VAQRGGLEGAQGWYLKIGSPANRRVVISGGGFAGVSTAQTLSKLLKKRHRAVDVVLLNRDNYFVFQLLLADILSATIETTHVVVPLRRMLPDVDIEVSHYSESRFLVEQVRYRSQINDAIELRLHAPVVRGVERVAEVIRRGHQGNVHAYLAYGGLGLLVVLVLAR